MGDIIVKGQKQHPLPPLRHFLLRMAIHLVLALVLIALGLCIGMMGYHFTEKMPWVDAFENAAMILSGMGPSTPLHSHGGKIFAGFYALFSGLLFIVLIGVLLAPILHRFLHKFHLDMS